MPRAGHWFSYVFLIDEHNVSDSGETSLRWTIGGFQVRTTHDYATPLWLSIVSVVFTNCFMPQGGEGSTTAAEFNIENSLDELDYPNEWYLDADTGDLYFYPNNTKYALHSIC